MHEKLRWKVCGMRDSLNISEISTFQPDYMGFIFYPPSPRNVDPECEINFEHLADSTSKVGVFVNERLEVIKAQIAKFQLDMVQLHGNESPESCCELSEIGVGVIKAFSVGKEHFDFSLLKPFESCVDYFLFDTKGKTPGGNGVTFRWDILEQYSSDVPIFLSGGIGLDQLEKLESFLKKGINVRAIDVNSQFEDEPGIKNVEDIKVLADWIEEWNRDIKD